MTTANWRIPASEDMKKILIDKDWSVELPHEYLWYEIGDITSLTDAEQASIVEQFFVKKPGFGDIELHRSPALEDHPVILRLRGNLRLLPSLKLRGRYCPLYQVGHSDDKSCLNFHALWDVLS